MNKRVEKVFQRLIATRRARIVTSAVLTVVIVGSAAALVLPYVPAIQHVVNPPDLSIPYTISVPNAFGDVEVDENATIPEENRLVMPSIGVDAEILEGQNIRILDQEEGVWREPETEDPVRGGNMVISGHRFQYTPPNTNTFYHLDKVKKGDPIVVFWDGKDYLYEVEDIYEVWPQQVEIKENTPEDQLTIYTCTPLGSTNKRLVVSAKPLLLN